MYRFLLSVVVLVLSALPVVAQQNMADVIYAPQPQTSIMAPNVPPEKNRSQVSAAQAELKARGYKIKVDGSFGPKTRGVLKKFQKAHGLAQTGVLDNPTLSALGVMVY